MIIKGYINKLSNHVKVEDGWDGWKIQVTIPYEFIEDLKCVQDVDTYENFIKLCCEEFAQALDQVYNYKEYTNENNKH